jgi:hypothetical protein
VDNTRIKSYDGEVWAERPHAHPEPRGRIPARDPHSIVLMKRDGSLQSIACTAGAAANQVVLATHAGGSDRHGRPPTEDGIRTIFSFAADSARAAQAWLVQEIGTATGSTCACARELQRRLLRRRRRPSRRRLASSTDNGDKPCRPSPSRT